jgi:hypothetical protein
MFQLKLEPTDREPLVELIEDAYTPILDGHLRHILRCQLSHGTLRFDFELLRRACCFGGALSCTESTGNGGVDSAR